MSINQANYPSEVWDGSSPVRSADRQIDSPPEYDDWDQIVAEVIALQSNPNPGAAAGTGVTASEISSQIYKTVITIEDLEIATVDATTAGAHGSQKIYDFPAGNIMILGAVADLTLLAGEGGVGDTAAVVASLGSVTVATDNATLTSTEADIIPSTTATLTDGASAPKGKSTATLIKDGTTTPVDVFLNLAVPDAGSSADDIITVNGTVTITWMNLGDV